MRKRFPVSFHKVFDDALAAKTAAKVESPDKEYQIRKNKLGFRLVERLHTNEAAVIHGMRMKKRKRGYNPVL